MDPERCHECGFDGSRFDGPALVTGLREVGPRWRTLIESAGPDLRVRPAPDVWSALEYAAHSRDITALHTFGVEQALTEDEPHYPAIEADLVEKAAAELRRRAAGRSRRHARRAGNEARLPRSESTTWTRGLTIGDERTDVRRLLEHALHDSTHHVRDVERGLAQIRAAGS